MKPNTIRRAILLSASGLLLAGAIGACSLLGEEEDNNDALALLALAGANNNSVAIQQNSQALAAEAAVNSAVQSAQQAGDLTAFLDVLPLNRENFHGMDFQSQLIPTAISRDSGSCTGTFPDQTCSVTFSGSASCVNGGTINFTSFTFTSTTTGSGSSVYNSDGSSEGSVTFSDCGVTYASIIDGKNDAVVLNGTISVVSNGTFGVDFSASPNSTLTRNGTTTITNSGDFSIDSTPVAWTQGVSGQQYNMFVEVLSTSPIRIRSTLTGTFTWNGATIANFVNEVRTASCTGSGANLECTLE